MREAVAFILMIVLASLSDELYCQKQAARYSGSVAADSAVYQLIIVDPGFEPWLALRPSSEYHSAEFYEFRNRIYVTGWNYRFMHNKFGSEYDSYIDYDPRTCYGTDLNYRLYYYFKYFEQKYGTKLYPASR